MPTALVIGGTKDSSKYVDLRIDSAAVRELLAGLLSKFDGVEIVGQASESKEATDGILAAKPDVVILDILLNKGSGLDVLSAVKKKLPSVVVIILSNYASFANRMTCKELGADHILDKTTGFEQLREIVAELVSGSKQT